LIIESEKNPVCFKLAIKIPIPKGNKKSRSFDDHRGISLLPSINKILERIVLSRLLKEPKYLHHPLQGGYQKQQDALTTCFTIEEVINQCLEEKEKVYVAYMDISKAFDTMGINSMLFKLYHNKGICGKAWCVLKGKVLEHTLFNKARGCSLAMAFPGFY
jgi:sarcosine oxidase/L-pipecolate oxidase